MMGNTVQKGLWLDPRAKLFLILMCVLCSMFAPSFRISCTCPADCCIGSALRKVEIFHKRGLLLCRGLCTDGLDHGGHDGDATDHVCCVPWTVP